MNSDKPVSEGGSATSVISKHPPAAGARAESRKASKPVPRDGPPDSILQALVEETLPSQASKTLARLLGSTMKVSGEGDRYAVSVAGRFDGAQATDLMLHAMKYGLSGALVVSERDEERVLYFSSGALVGAASTVLFETLGRLLYQAKVVTHEDSSTLVDAEEAHGAHSLLLWLSSEHLRWAVERRAWEVVAAICLIKRGYFAFVEGEPTLEGPALSLDPAEVTREGDRRAEEWRSGSGGSEGLYVPPKMATPPSPIQRPARPLDISAETIRDILVRIRDAEEK